MQAVTYYLEFREAVGKWRFVRAIEGTDKGDVEVEKGSPLHARLVQAAQALESQTDSIDEKAGAIHR